MGYVPFEFNKMPNIRKQRKISANIQNYAFKPNGVKARDLKATYLAVEEVEALRLSNIEQLTCMEASTKMAISKSTFHRILNGANFKITDALLNGKAIFINNTQEAALVFDNKQSKKITRHF